MEKILFLAAALFCTAATCAQNSLFIKGSVFDGKTGEALVSASVYYNNSQRGTITNDEGEFVLPIIPQSDSVTISYLGYKAKSFLSSEIPEKIYLIQSDLMLSEILITPDYPYILVDSIGKKYSEIRKQELELYASSENSVDKFKKYSYYYRQITKTDKVYNEFIESFFTGINYRDNIKELELQEGRYARIQPSTKDEYLISFTNFFAFNCNAGFFTPYLTDKAINSKKFYHRYIQPNVRDIYVIKITERFTNHNDEDIFVLNFTPKKAVLDKKRIIMEGRIYVRMNDMCVVRSEGRVINYASMVNYHDKSVSAYNTNMRFSVSYKDVRDRDIPIVESVQVNYEVGVKRKKKYHTAQVKSTLFLTEPVNSTNKEKMESKDDLKKVIAEKEYNPDFWANNPIVKRTKIEEEVIRSFEGKKLFGNFLPDNDKESEDLSIE